MLSAVLFHGMGETFFSLLWVVGIEVSFLQYLISQKLNET